MCGDVLVKAVHGGRARLLVNQRETASVDDLVRPSEDCSACFHADIDDGKARGVFVPCVAHVIVVCSVAASHMTGIACTGIGDEALSVIRRLQLGDEGGGVRKSKSSLGSGGF